MGLIELKVTHSDLQLRTQNSELRIPYCWKTVYNCLQHLIKWVSNIFTLRH